MEVAISPTGAQESATHTIAAASVMPNVSAEIGQLHS